MTTAPLRTEGWFVEELSDPEGAATMKAVSHDIARRRHSPQPSFTPPSLHYAIQFSPRRHFFRLKVISPPSSFSRHHFRRHFFLIAIAIAPQNIFHVRYHALLYV
jgi:hypothetical protein